MNDKERQQHLKEVARKLKSGFYNSAIAIKRTAEAIKKSGDLKKK